MSSLDHNIVAEEFQSVMAYGASPDNVPGLANNDNGAILPISENKDATLQQLAPNFQTVYHTEIEVASAKLSAMAQTAGRDMTFRAKDLVAVNSISDLKTTFSPPPPTQSTAEANPEPESMAAQEEQTETLQVWEKQPELTAQELQERNAHVIALTDEIMPEELEAFLPQGVVDVDLDQAQAHTDPWKVAQTHGITEAQIQQTALADTFLLEERQQVGQPELVAPNLAEPQQVEIDQDLRLQEPAPVAQDVDQPKQVALNLTEEHPIVNQEQVTLGNTQTGNTAVLENEQVSAAFSTTTPGQPGTSVIEGNAGSVGTAPIAQPVTVASAEFINWDTLDLGAAPKTASRLPEQQAV